MLVSDPTTKSDHQVAVGPVLYVFGGCDAAGRTADLHSFDTRTSCWSKLPSADIAGRGGAGFAALDGGDLAVVGGFCGNERNDVLRYRVGAAAWERCAAAEVDLRPRSVFGIGSLPGDTVVVVGGEVDPR